MQRGAGGQLRSIKYTGFDATQEHSNKAVELEDSQKNQRAAGKSNTQDLGRKSLWLL